MTPWAWVRPDFKPNSRGSCDVRPNVYVPVTALEAKAKVDALMAAHKDQRKRDWFTRDTFMSLLRLRRLECRSPSGYAEAFHGRKLRIAGI